MRSGGMCRQSLGAGRGRVLDQLGEDPADPGGPAPLGVQLLLRGQLPGDVGHAKLMSRVGVAVVELEVGVVDQGAAKDRQDLDGVDCWRERGPSWR